MTHDLVLRNARILTSSETIDGDIAVKGGLVTSVGAVSGSAVKEIDCEQRIVTPGGVDAHCHIEQMSGMGLMNADTWETATRSAAMGGTTTVVSFAAQAKGQRLKDAVADYSRLARRGAAIDHAFHMIVSDPTVPHQHEDLKRLIDDGHRSIKLFTTYNIKLDDRAFCDVLATAKEAGALVCVHAENDGLIGWTKDALVAGGKTAPRHHALSHPRLAEIEAVGRMIAFAEFFATPIMLFHISVRESVEAIRAAQARGVPVWAETCPHYLMMTEEVLHRSGTEGAKWMCSPPQRQSDDQTALWEALSDGTISLVSSDHAPYRYDETGKLSAGPTADFTRIANGLPGLEVRMPLLFDRMQRGDLDPHAFIRMSATEPARCHALARKGDIAEGFDADLVIWNSTKETTFGKDDLHDNVGYNPWVGHTVRGWPETVIQRGTVLVESGSYTGEPGAGQWLHRAAIGLAPSIAPAREYTEATT